MIKPIRRRVLVQIFEKKEQTTSGIYIPSALQKQNEGLVIAVSEDAKLVKVGDKVRYYPNRGTEYIHEGKDCLFLKEDIDIELILD